MPNLLETSFFIPTLPFFSAFFLGLLLVSFNRTINRLTKPVSFIVISSFLISTLYSMLLYYKNIVGELLIQPLSIIGIVYGLNLIFSETSETYLIVIGLIAFIVTFAFYLKSPRKTGYVRSIVILAVTFSLLLLYVLNNHSLNAGNLNFLNTV